MKHAVHPVLSLGLAFVAVISLGAAIGHWKGHEKATAEAGRILPLLLYRADQAGYQRRAAEEQPLIVFCPNHEDDAHRWWEADRWR